jgi:hypothetical protein
VASPKLSETAMLIYVYIQSHSRNDLRLREVQQAMGWSSPSSALFHLQKLEAAGLILKDPTGNYRIKTRIRVGVVKDFVILRGILIPKHLFYAVVTTLATILYFILLQQFLSSPIAIIAVLLNAASVGVFSYESWQDWKNKPRFAKS